MFVYVFIAEGERRLPARARWRRRRRRQPTGAVPTTAPLSSAAAAILPPPPSAVIRGTIPPHPTPRRLPMLKGKTDAYSFRRHYFVGFDIFYLTSINSTHAGQLLIIDGTRAGNGSGVRRAARARRAHRVEAPRAVAGGGGGARARARPDQTPVRRSPATARAPPRRAQGNWRVRRSRRSLLTPRSTITTTRYLYLLKMLGST